MKQISLMIFALTAALMCACGSEKRLEEKVETIPFQSEKDGRWGMMTTDGDVLFEEEFDNAPTMAFNGRFFVKNKDGLYEIYTAEEKPEQVGETAYKEIAPFTEDVTPAVQPEKGVVLIDRDGKEVADLATLSDKKVKRVTMFNEGLAIFTTTDDLMGAINTSGEVVIEPEYCRLGTCVDGRLIAIDKKYKSAVDADEMSKASVTILNTSGKEVGGFSLKHFSEINLSPANGSEVLLATESKGDHRPGLIDFEGEWVMKPSDKVKSIENICDKYIIYTDGDKYGLRTIDDEGLIRPKFDYMYFGADDILIASDRSKDRDKRYALYDMKGERIGEKRFRNIYLFLGNGKYAPVEYEKHDCGLIDRDGAPVDLGKTDVYAFNIEIGEYVVESDLIDYEGIVAALQITADGLDGVQLDWTAERAIDYIHNIDSNTSLDAEDYKYSGYTDYSRYDAIPGTLNMRVDFTLTAATPITRYHDYGYGYGYNETVGYSYNSDSKVDIVTATIPCEGRLEGKSEGLFRAISSKVKSLGTVVNSNSNACVLRLNNGRYALVANYGNTVKVAVAIYDWSSYDISDIGGSNSDSEVGYDSDSVAVDSCAVDDYDIAEVDSVA